MAVRSRKTVQLNVRLPAELASQLKQIAAHEHLEQVDVARQLLWKGVARRRLQIGQREYAAGKVSVARAAELAGISLWEFHDELARRRQRQGYSVDDLQADVRAIAAAEGLGPPSSPRPSA